MDKHIENPENPNYVDNFRAWLESEDAKNYMADRELERDLENGLVIPCWEKD